MQLLKGETQNNAIFLSSTVSLCRAITDKTKITFPLVPYYSILTSYIFKMDFLVVDIFAGALWEGPHEEKWGGNVELCDAKQVERKRRQSFWGGHCYYSDRKVTHCFMKCRLLALFKPSVIVTQKRDFPTKSWRRSSIQSLIFSFRFKAP